MKKVLVIILIFLSSSFYGYQLTNIVTNISEFVNKTNIIVQKRYIPVRKTIYHEMTVTNYQNLYYSVYETNTITNQIDVTNTVPSTEIYRQHHMVTAGYSYCGRLYFGYDWFNIFSNGYSGLGLGTWMTWNTMNFGTHNLDVGIRFNITF